MEWECCYADVVACVHGLWLGIEFRDYDVYFCFVCSDCASQGPQLARLATLKAKRKALEHMKAIKQDIDSKNRLLEDQLEQHKEEARKIKSSVSPISERLENIQKIAYAWESTHG